MSTSTETRIPTQTFLLPGQKFCIGLPWERAALPRGGVPAPPSTPGPARLTLRDEKERADPCEGWELGACRVLRRLSDDSARTLLAVRTDELEGPELVVMRRIDLPEVLAREARTHAEWAARFSHPNLARVFEPEMGDEGVFWVTQLSSGATLAELAQLMRRQGHGVPFGLTLAVVLEAARALAELHGAGAAHGLIRDQSLAVTLDGSARLLDTGLFRCLAQGASWLEVREAMGPYFAPEQLLEGRLPDPKTDVYSLGVVLYEGLTGEPLRRGKTFEQHVQLVQSGKIMPPSRLNVVVGPALDEVLQRALSPERSKRYPNAREFAAALSEAASAFMWRRDQRAQFVARHFDERRRQDEALRELIAGLPPRPAAHPVAPPQPAGRPVAPARTAVRARTLVEAAIPSVDLPPLSVPRPPVRQRQAPRPSAPRPPAPRPRPSAPRSARVGKRAPSRSLAPVLGLASALVGFLVSAFAVPALRPAAPLPVVAVVQPAPVAVVVVDAAEPLDQQVERVTLEPAALTSPALASIEPPLVEVAAAAEVPAPRRTRVMRRASDEVPIPPWLVKRSRR